MIYFDNAATGGIKPQTVSNIVYSTIKGQCANVGRSGHKLSVEYAENVLKTRKLARDFFNADSYERVIFTKNCTEALNILLLGSIPLGAHIVTTAMEHNSVLRPLEHLKKIGKITLSVAPVSQDGIASAESIASLVNGNTYAIVVTLASNVNGKAPDIVKLKSLIRDEILIFCDGAQACGHINIDMKKQQIDALTVAGHKGMHGIQGSGMLIFSNRTEIEPTSFGGTGSESFNLNMPEFFPDGLEAGTLSYPAIMSLYEGIVYLKENLLKDGNHIIKLCERLASFLATHENFKLYSSPNPFGIISFCHKNISSEDLATILSEEYDIATRGGLHCAPLMHEGLQTDYSGLLRVSFSGFNTIYEVERLIYALQRIN